MPESKAFVFSFEVAIIGTIYGLWEVAAYYTSDEPGRTFYHFDFVLFSILTLLPALYSTYHMRMETLHTIHPRLAILANPNATPILHAVAFVFLRLRIVPRGAPRLRRNERARSGRVLHKISG